MRYVFDFDGTIVNTDLEYNILSVDKKMVEKINNLYYKGHTVIIWTGRHWDKLDLTKKQLEKIGVGFHTLLMAKPTADYYIDDRAMDPEKFHELYEPQQHTGYLQQEKPGE